MNNTDRLEGMTQAVMERIEPWLGDGANAPDIRYAIERAISSAMTIGADPLPTDMKLCGRFYQRNGPPCQLLEGHAGPCGERPSVLPVLETDDGIPVPVRHELLHAARTFNCSYYYLCAIYEHGYRHGKRDAAPQLSYAGRAPFIEETGKGPLGADSKAEWMISMLRHTAESLIPDAKHDAARGHLDKYRIGQLSQIRLNLLSAADFLGLQRWHGRDLK